MISDLHDWFYLGNGLKFNYHRDDCFFLEKVSFIV